MSEPHPPPRSPSRRSFLGGALAGGALGLGGCRSMEVASGDTPRAPSSFDLHVGSPTQQADRTVRSACQFCNSLCGLDVAMKDDRVLRIDGLGGDPVQMGQLCVKAELMTELVYNPRRLRTPMKRIGGAKGSPDSSFAPISWDEALESMATKLLQIRDEGDAHCVANKTSGRMPRGAGDLIARFFTLYGSPNATDVGPVCNDAGGNALAATFGLGNFTNGYGVDPATGEEDLGRADFYFLLGTNQAETHPVTFSHLLRERARRGARMVCVDPRATATSQQCDEWIAPKPHTDLALVLGMLGHILRRDLHDRAFVDEWTLGFDELRRHVREQGYGPEWAESRCDVPAARIRALAESYARAKRAAIFCNAGISHQLNAFTTYRSLAILAAITGNVGVPGGGCNFMHNTWPGGLQLPPIEAEALPERREGLPVGPDSFATSILDGVPYRLRAVITAGNPLLASANSSRVRAAFEQLEYFVYTGLFAEEPAAYADLILPVPSGLELDGVYMRRDDRAIRWQEAAVDRVGECRSDPEIWIDLAQAMEKLDRSRPEGYWAGNFPQEWRDSGRLWAEFVARTPGMAGMSEARLRERDEPLRWPCPSEDHPGVSTLYLDHPSWEQAAAALGHAGKRFLTPSGKVELYTDELEARLAPSGHSALPQYFTHPEVKGATESLRYGALVPNPLHPDHLTPSVELGVSPVPRTEFPLMGMIGRSSVVHFAGLTHWTPTGKHLDGVRRIQLHPELASELAITAGDRIVVESPRGSVEGSAEPWEGIRRDTVFVPNGFGVQQEVGDGLGVPRYSDPANTLVDDRYHDSLSGQQAYKCFACRIRKA